MHCKLCNDNRYICNDLNYPCIKEYDMYPIQKYTKPVYMSPNYQESLIDIAKVAGVIANSEYLPIRKIQAIFLIVNDTLLCPSIDDVYFAKRCIDLEAKVTDILERKPNNEKN